MKLVLFGCSHTATSFYKSFDESKYQIINKSFNGNSNQKIFHDVYTYLNSDEYQKDDILVIQYTYTNRLWWPNKLNGSEFSFHSFDTEQSPIYYLNKFASEELVNFYSTFIKYFWNYDTAFTTHKMNIDLLKNYLDGNNVNFIHWMYTDGGNTQEWNQGFDKFWKNSDSNNIFSELNLFNIDGEYRIQDWAKKLNFVDDTDHISEDGNEMLAEKISKIIEKKFG